MSRHLATALVFGLAGSAIAAQDLLVCSLLSDQVLRFDGVTGASKGVFADTHIDGPEGITLGPDGNVYVASEYTGNITKWSPSGAFLGEFVPPMAGWEDLEFGPDGNLYAIAHFGTVDGPISKFDGTTGAYLGQTGVGGGLHHQHGMTFGPDGGLYYSRVDIGSVTRIDIGSGLVTGDIVVNPLLAGEFDMVFHGGFLYTDDHFSGGGVHKFNPVSGAYMGDFVPPSGAGTWGMAFHTDGLFYVSTGGSILRYDGTTGAFHDEFATGIAAAAGFTFVPESVPEPTSLAVFGLGVLGLWRGKRLRR